MENALECFRLKEAAPGSKGLSCVWCGGVCTSRRLESDLAVLEMQLLIPLDDLLGKGRFVFWQNFINIT